MMIPVIIGFLERLFIATGTYTSIITAQYNTGTLAAIVHSLSSIIGISAMDGQSIHGLQPLRCIVVAFCCLLTANHAAQTGEQTSAAAGSSAA